MTARAVVGGALLTATLLTGCAVGTTWAPPHPATGDRIEVLRKL
jgi:hypothetical protein